MATSLPTVLLVLSVASLALVLTFQGAAHRLLSQPRRRPKVRMPISVLKPLRGTDPDLFANLAACAEQDYPSFELVLGTEDPDDPALEVAHRLARAYPRVPITVVAGGPAPGLNPKVNNLRHLARYARHDLLLVSDADVRPDPGYLDAMMAEIEDPAVGLVSSLLAGTGERTVGAALENLHLASLAVTTVAAAHSLARQPLVVGKSMLFRRSDLDALGGWELVQNVLAEDYLLGRAFHQAGWKVALSAAPLPVFNRRRTLVSFLLRHLRWGQMRCRIHRLAYLGELFLLPTVWALGALATAWSLAPQRAPGVSSLALGVVALRSLADGVLLARLRGGWLAPASLLSPVKDLLVLALWPCAAVRRRLDWRGHPLEIGAGSVLRRLEPRSFEHQTESFHGAEEVHP